MTPVYALTFTALVVVASLSPILTFARLWQLKEWRGDRLREHLRAEGWWTQIFGSLRPPLAAFLIIFSGFDFFLENGAITALFILACLSIGQIVLKRQPFPVWTMKALSIVMLSLLLAILDTAGALLLAEGAWAEWRSGILTSMILAPVFAPVYVFIAWAVLRPLDITLKNRTLARAQNVRRAHPNVTVIGITGSVGKTTAKELLAHILKEKNAVATPEHVNSEMGVAAWLTRVLSKEPADAAKILIVEMGAYKRGEIAVLCRITQPKYGIITYVGSQHLTLFGSHEAIIDAKGELFAALPENGKAFGNSDNDAYAALKKRCRCEVVSVGTGQHADIQATDIEETSQGLSFKALSTTFRVPIAGTHSIASILLAIAAAKELGMEAKDIARRLASFKPLHSTFEVKPFGSATLLDDTYNSSPDSMRAAIEWAAKQPHEEKILVVEGIIELGHDEERIHTELAKLASTVFSSVYTAHSRYLPYFQRGGFEGRAFMIEQAHPAERGALVVCVGRIRPSSIERFRPL